MADVLSPYSPARFLVSVSLILLAGCARPAPFTFDVAADMRSFTPPEHPGPHYFSGVCEAIREIGSGDFMVSPGDFDPPPRVRTTLDEVLGNHYIWYPVVGNHEGDSPEYMAYLREYNAGGTTLPGIVRPGPRNAIETCYSFDYRNAHLVVINEYYDGTGDMATDGDVPDPLYDWLADDLAATDREIIFVFGHEPSVAVPDIDNGRVRHRGVSLDKYPDNNHRFWSLLRKHNVVAYVCGHSHNASIAKINGVWQLDAGHARGRGDPGARSSFLRIHVDGGRVRCDVYRADRNGENYTLTYSERLR